MPDVEENQPSRFLTQPTRLLGREYELALTRSLLQCASNRLVTLVGPAGVGKTRLALEVGAQLAGDFSRGATFVDLTPVRDPALVLRAMAHRMGLRETVNGTLLDQIRGYLQDETAMLILDNFEHVQRAAAQVADLLAACPGLTLLVTSRSPLHLQWEQTVLLSPLPLPDLDAPLSPDELVQIPSVALFLERARARQPDFSPAENDTRLVAELVVRLDGLPLAIELAAARLSVLPLPLLARRLGDRLYLLRSDGPDLPDRHRSLHAAIDWSYQLLSQEEQQLFRHLGVFLGYASLGAIAAVTGARDEDQTLDRMVSLAEKSLVLPGQQEDGDQEPSFGILETMREYASDQLEQEGELDDARTRHARYFLELTEQADRRLRTNGSRAWFLRLEAEHDNLRQALRWLLDHDRESALSLAAALGFFWYARGHHIEGWRWLDEALRNAPNADPAVRSRALLGAGWILVGLGDYRTSKTVLEEALALSRQRHDDADEARALVYLGYRAISVGDVSGGMSFIRQPLDYWERVGDEYRVAETLFYLATGPIMQGDFEEAAAILGEALARHQTLGNEHTTSMLLSYLAAVVRHLGDLPRAAKLVREVIEVSGKLHDRWLLVTGAETTLLLTGDRGDQESRARLLGAVDALRQTIGFTHSVWGQRLAPDESITRIRGQIEQTGLQATHRAGRSLPFEDIVDLALTLVDAFSRTLSPAMTEGELEIQVSPLSPREQEVLHLVAEGFSDKQIARELALGERTVRRHLSSILNKLGAGNRPQAVAIAMRRGLL